MFAPVPLSPFGLLLAAAAARLRRLARARALRDRRGSAAVQFAVAIPVFILLVFGLIEIAMILFVNSLMEGGLREAARFGITGFDPDGQSRTEQILQIVGVQTQGLVDMEQVDIDFLVYPSFDDIGQPEPYTDANGNGSHDAGEAFTDVNGNGAWDADMGAAGLGGPGDIVVYTLTYDWDPLTGLLDPVLGGADGLMTLRASIVVRNEPFGAQAGGAGLAGGSGT
jgi:hypothetical protein